MPTHQALRDGLIEAIITINPTIWITLTVAHTTCLSAAERDIYHWLQRIEYDVYHKRWAKRPPHMRLCAYGFFEHPYGNLHIHLPMSGPDRLISNALFRGVPLWREMTVVGHGEADVIDSPEAVARYVTKNTKAGWSVEHFIAYGPHGRKLVL